MISAAYNPHSKDPEDVKYRIGQWVRTGLIPPVESRRLFRRRRLRPRAHHYILALFVLDSILAILLLTRP